MSEDLSTQMLPTAIPTSLKRPEDQPESIIVGFDGTDSGFARPVRMVERRGYEPMTLRPWSRPRGVVL